MNCPTCQKIVASNAYNCPNCGHKFRSTPVNIFFKIVLILIAISITLGIVVPLVLFGTLGGVYYSAKGEEVVVPKIVGMDFVESERELTQLGLKIKKRAVRISKDKPNTILEQSPKAGEQALKGQQVLVVISSSNLEEIPR